MRLSDFANARYNPDANIYKLLRSEDIKCSFHPSTLPQYLPEIQIETNNGYLNMNLRNKEHILAILNAIISGEDSVIMNTRDYCAESELRVEKGNLFVVMLHDTAELYNAVCTWKIPVSKLIEPLKEALQFAV